MSLQKQPPRQARPAPLDPIDAIWLQLRRPFAWPQKGHACQWERFDVDRAGCLRCGRLHRCASGMVGCSCPLVETDDGGHACTITGLCIAEVRICPSEYVDHAVFETAPGASTAMRHSFEDEQLHDRVQCIVGNFLLSPGTLACRRLELRKFIQKRHQAMWRVLKQRKRDDPYRLPDLCSVVSEVAVLEPPPRGLIQILSGSSRRDAAAVVRQSSAGIAAGVMQIYRMGFRKIYQGNKFDSMVIGMLYMLRTGLSAGDAFSLPTVPYINEFLPSETYLNSLGVSNKVICDTENEIKSCIRAFTERQVPQPGHAASVHSLSNSAGPSQTQCQGAKPATHATPAASRKRKKPVRPSFSSSAPLRCPVRSS